MNLVEAIKAAQSTNQAIRLKGWSPGVSAYQDGQYLSYHGSRNPVSPTVKDMLSKHWELVPGKKFVVVDD